MENNKRSWIVVLYFYLISAICVITVLFGAINGLMGLYQMIDPEINLDRQQWETYASSDAFRRLEQQPVEKHLQVELGLTTDTLRTARALSEQEWEERWQDHRRVVLEGQVREGRRNLINMIVIFVVALPVFWLHWRCARRQD